MHRADRSIHLQARRIGMTPALPNAEKTHSTEQPATNPFRTPTRRSTRFDPPSAPTARRSTRLDPPSAPTAGHNVDNQPAENRFAGVDQPAENVNPFGVFGQPAENVNPFGGLFDSGFDGTRTRQAAGNQPSAFGRAMPSEESQNRTPDEEIVANLRLTHSIDSEKTMVMAEAVLPPQEFVQSVWTLPPVDYPLWHNVAQYVRKATVTQAEINAFISLALRVQQLFCHYEQGDIPMHIMVRMLNDLANWFIVEGRKAEYNQLSDSLWPHGVMEDLTMFSDVIPLDTLEMLTMYPCYDNHPALPEVTGFPLVSATTVSTNENSDCRLCPKTARMMLHLEKEKQQTITTEESEKRQTITTQESEKRLTITTQESEKRLTVEVMEDEKRKTEVEKQKTAAEELQAEAAKQTTEAAKQKTNREHEEEKRRTIETQSTADIEKLEMQIELEKIRRTPYKPPPQENQLPVVAPSPANLMLSSSKARTQKRLFTESTSTSTPTATRKRPSTATVPLPSTSKKKQLNQWGYTTIKLFSGDGSGCMPQPSQFTQYLEGACDSNLLFTGSRPRRVEIRADNGEPIKAKCQVWTCGCGGAKLRIVHDPEDPNIFWIQRAESKPSLLYHKRQDGSKGQPLEAKSS